MYAKADLTKIDNMFIDYKEFEEQAIARTGTGRRNATGPNQRCDAALNKFMDENRIAHTMTAFV